MDQVHQGSPWTKGQRNVPTLYFPCFSTHTCTFCILCTERRDSSTCMHVKFVQYGGFTCALHAQYARVKIYRSFYMHLNYMWIASILTKDQTFCYSYSYTQSASISSRRKVHTLLYFPIWENQAYMYIHVIWLDLGNHIRVFFLDRLQVNKKNLLTQHIA